MNPYRRYTQWRIRAPAWQVGLVSGVEVGVLFTLVFGRGESWLSIGLGAGGGLFFGVWVWLYSPRWRRTQPPRLEPVANGRRIAMTTCEAIVSGTVSPHDGARTIWWDAWTLLADEPAGGELAPFIGLRTEWDEHPEARPQVEADIRQRARELLERWRAP